MTGLGGEQPNNETADLAELIRDYSVTLLAMSSGSTRTYSDVLAEFAKHATEQLRAARAEISDLRAERDTLKTVCDAYREQMNSDGEVTQRLTARLEAVEALIESWPEHDIRTVQFSGYNAATKQCKDAVRAALGSGSGEPKGSAAVRGLGETE